MLNKFSKFYYIPLTFALSSVAIGGPNPIHRIILPEGAVFENEQEITNQYIFFANGGVFKNGTTGVITSGNGTGFETSVTGRIYNRGAMHFTDGYYFQNAGKLFNYGIITGLPSDAQNIINYTSSKYKPEVVLANGTYQNAASEELIINHGITDIAQPPAVPTGEGTDSVTKINTISITPDIATGITTILTESTSVPKVAATIKVLEPSTPGANPSIETTYGPTTIGDGYDPNTTEGREAQSDNIFAIYKTRLDDQKVFPTATAVNVARATDVAQSVINFDSSNGSTADPTNPKINIDSAIYSIEGFSDNLGNVAPVDQNLIINKTGPGTATFNGNCSWFNGVFNLQEGSAVFPEHAALPGGDVNLKPNTTLTWEGGPKDEYNKPNIIMDNAKLIFNLVNAGGSNDVFSFYGDITGDQKSEVDFEKGLVYIKGKCDSFKGDVYVKPGSQFIVRSKEGGYTGTMFGGNIYVVDSNGNPGTMTISTSDGLTPLSIAGNSTVKITNDSENPANSNPSSMTIVDTSVGAGSTLEVQCHNPVMQNINASGTVIFSSTTSNLAVLENANIDGGSIQVAPSAGKLVDLHFKGDCHVGSGIKTMGNGVIDTIHAETATFTVYPGRNFEFSPDLQPSTGLSDNIVAKNINFTVDAQNPEGASSLKIKEFGTIDKPTKDYYYRFKVLTLLDPNATYIPITISEEAAKQTVIGTLGTYKLYAEGGNGYITLRLPNAYDLEYNDTVQSELGSKFTPLKAMHSYELADDITSTYLLVSDETRSNAANDKYRFWVKSRFSDNGVSEPTDVKSVSRDMVFGIDGKPIMFKNGTNLAITVFGSYGSGNLKYLSQRARQTKYIAGTKVSWFGEKNCLELLGSYSLFNTKLRDVTDITKLKSNVYSLGLKYGYSIDFNKNFTITPDIMTTASYLSTPKTQMQVTTPNLPTKTEIINNKSKVIFDVAPGLNFITKKKNFSANIFARYHQKFGAHMKSYINDSKIDSVKEHKSHSEIGLKVNYDLKTTAAFGVGISKFIGGKKGFKAECSIGIKF